MDGPSNIFRAPNASLFIGRLGQVAPHVHRSAAMVLPLDGPIRVRTENGRWQRCFGVWVPPRCAHRLDCDQRQVAVLYLDPLRYGSLLPEDGLELAHDEQRWAELGARHLASVLPALLKGGDLTATEVFCAEEILPRVTGRHAPPRHPLGRDVRDVLRDIEIQDLHLANVARAVALSPSRFSHLFTAHFGVTWTAYRNWRRLLIASTALCQKAASITEVALRLGYSSHAHLTAAFRTGFGLTPTQLRALHPHVHLPKRSL